MDKKKKMIAAVAGGVVLLAVVLLLVFGGSGKDEADLRASFTQLSMAKAMGNKDDAGRLVSKKFNDAEMDYNVAVEEFGVKRPGYQTEVISVSIANGQADVTYTRKQMVGKSFVESKVAGETWVKEEDGNWRLVKLSDADRQSLPKERQARKEAEEKLAAEIKAAEDAENALRFAGYSPIGKRDPFESLILEGASEEGTAATDSSKNCDAGRPRQFLEGFDLYAFKLAGTVAANGFYALIEGPNGNGYTVKPGMYIGRRCGRITKITPDRMVVAEKFLNTRGEFVVKEMELKLKKEE